VTALVEELISSLEALAEDSGGGGTLMIAATLAAAPTLRAINASAPATPS
jgi:hypothetical protein